MSLSENKSETYTMICYFIDGDETGPHIQVFLNENLSKKEETLFQFWEAKNKENSTSADVSCGRDTASTKQEKKYVKMAELLEKDEKSKRITDISKYIGKVNRMIRFFNWC